MSETARAMLMYGYDLGGNNVQGWAIRGVDAGQDWWPSWLNDRPSISNFSWVEAVTARLATARAEALVVDADAGQLMYGVNLVPYGHYSDRSYALITHEQEAYLDRAQTVDPSVFLNTGATIAWDRQLTWALQALQLNPVQVQPRWLLASGCD